MYLFIIGTRPEAIKICPLILKFKESNIPHKILLSGQHTTMVDEVLDIFKVTADFNLNIMKPGQTPNYIVSEIIIKLEKILQENEFKYVIVHGDTSTALAGAFCAFQNKVKIIHVEAGLRTTNVKSPFPEESNRRIISMLTDISFIPTNSNLQNLIKENNKSEMHVVGNTVIDAIEFVKKTYSLPNKIIPYKFILLTTHRRENISTMADIFLAINNICEKHKIKAIIPMHPNPKIKDIFTSTVKNNNHIQILPPQNYVDFCNLLMQCCLVVTDSGGVQEEASYLGKRMVILREMTERQEIDADVNTELAGSNIQQIELAIEKFLLISADQVTNMTTHLRMGSGDTSSKIVDIIKSK